MTRTYSTPVAHSAPWLVARLFAELDADTSFAEELQLSLDSRGVRDRERALLALLGVMSYASRAGCRPVQVRRLVGSFARRAATERLDAEATETFVQHCVGLVDAVYLLYGRADISEDVESVAATLACA